MAQRSATERTVKYATTVDDLTDAWAFVMQYVEEVGPSPQITISPMWQIEWDGIGEAPPSDRRFEVAISGMVEE